jgi:hypothetical protein
MQPSNASKRLIFHPSTLPPRRGFITHRRAHMRACSLHRRARMRACPLHRGALMRTCFPHRRARERACPPYRRALVRACQTHRRALMRACSQHRRALRARLKLPYPRTHALIFSGQARTYARLPLNRPCMWAHILSKIPSNPLYGPPYLPCPKIENLFLCRMIRPLT